MTAPDTRWIIVPNWHGDENEEGFQHYHDRDPIWIKNYRRLLTNPDYLALSSSCRALLHGLWLLYASSDGQVQLRERSRDVGRMFETRSIAGQLNLRVLSSHIESLNHAGWIDIVASRPLALRYQRASPEREGEKRERREEKPKAVTRPGGTAPDELDNVKALIDVSLKEAS